MKCASIRSYVFSAILLTASAVSGCKRDPPPRDAVEPIESSAPTPPSSKAQRERDMSADASIGVATMQPDGTIVLDLRAEGPGMLGDARITYPKSHPEYDSVLKHLGGLTPGDSKPVPPWPDDS